MDLKVAVDQYVSRKRLMGFRYENNSKELRAFVRMFPDIPLSQIKVSHVDRFFDRPSTGRGTWIARYVRMKAFFSYWKGRQEMSRIPMPRPRRQGNRPFSPYIFTTAQFNALLKVSSSLDHQLTAVTSETFRVFLVTLYATGMWLGEALSLSKRDVDLDSAVIHLKSRFASDRKIPIGHDLNELLKKHLAKSHVGDYVFSTKTGGRILTHRAKVLFRRSIKRAGINREDGSARQPGLRDLRHTFAVNRITDWERNRRDLDLMLPRLAVYMGLRTFSVTERYLPLAPTHFREETRMLSLAQIERGKNQKVS
jgi:integrase/recombinase XerD